MSDLQILYQDDDFVAVNKPPGMVVHRSGMVGEVATDLVSEVKGLVGCRVFPCHRLDRPTSGVVLLAFAPETVRLVQEKWNSSVVEKEYVAIVRGWIGEPGKLDYPLRLEEPRTRGGVLPLQSAVTVYHPRAWYEHPVSSGRYATTRLTLCSLKPRTGRRHQLRRHLAHLRHPIVGDTTHGDGKLNRWAREQTGSHRLFLHSGQLTFPDSRSGEMVTITASPDSEWEDLLEDWEPYREWSNRKGPFSSI